MKACAIEHKFITCTDCTEFQDFKKCKKLNNLVSNFFGFIFGTNRIANLEQIKKVGIDKFKEEKFADGKT